MRNLIRLAAFASAAVAALPAAAQTKIVTPPGSTTRVTTTPRGDQIITVNVNQKPVTFEETRRPMMLSGRVMVPLRGVIERLGGNVLWDAKERVVTGAHPGSKQQFRIRVGSNDALVNGENMTLDAPPRVTNGTTYVPLRFVSEALGAQVRWDNASRTVTITAADGSAAAVE
uniref:Copper amine oxidase-like N-terminal domain-containing protein n=1 Tax=uncultured Armatimonadetes bacterium TaxID=157466 RepID=A0A6J4JHI7_9BACT|nr:hypothetical protein AVDCRST_MAG63-3313 [uncultured Armatimonadetes bacterium]